MQVWPLAILTIVLTVGLGLSIANLEKGQIMKNWDTRRCNIPVMATASYFKPPDDPRTPSEFSTDNFKFCMKSLVESATDIAMAPISAIFSSHIGIASEMSTILTQIRSAIATMHNAFLSYVESFFGQYQAAIYQISRIAQHIRMSLRRVSAVMMSMIFTGLTVIRGMLNTVNFFIKVIVIILGILVALLIILFFILFPFIPVITSLIVALMAVTVGATAGALESYRESFCFAPGTQVMMSDGSCRSIEKIEIGDQLVDGIVVEAKMVVDGAKTPLYKLDGILVSGSHLVFSDNWHSVSKDPRAKQTSTVHTRLYCLNTSNRIIPVKGLSGRIQFRDWEELATEDLLGQYGWGYHVLATLNKYQSPEAWKHSLSAGINPELPLISANTLVLTKDLKQVPIGSIKIGDLIADASGFTEVLGILEGETERVEVEPVNQWYTQLIIFNKKTNVWERHVGCRGGKGIMIFTESGTFYIIQNNDAMLIRDFTEVGHKQIHRTYPFVATRIVAPRSSKTLNNNLTRKAEL